jgi:hypothetical protein
MTLITEYFNTYALLSVCEQIDTRSASGRLVLNVLTSVAQWEREAIGERTSQALQYKKGQGERVGTISGQESQFGWSIFNRESPGATCYHIGKTV